MIGLDPEPTLHRIPRLDETAHTVSHGLHRQVLNAGEPARRAVDILHGTWLGHPLHVVLTDLTVGAWTLATVFDLIASQRRSRAAEIAADRLLTIGNASAIPTALTGLADFSTIPHPAMATGFTHGILNFGGFLCNLISASARRRGRRASAVVLSAVTTASLAVSAWLGGELVYKHKVGVDRSPSPSGPDHWTNVLDDQDLPEETLKRVQVDGIPVLLYRSDGRIDAIGAICSHAGAPLEQGDAQDGRLTCPWHQSVFDLHTGKVIHGPAAYPVAGYETRIEDGVIQIRLNRCRSCT